MFLEECKYIIKEKKINQHIDDDFENSPDYSDEEASNEDEGL